MNKILILLFITITLNAGIVEKAKRYYAMGNHKKAAKYMPKACDVGDARSCYFAGYLYSNGIGISQDMKKAVEFYDKACKGGLTKACYYYKKYTKNTYVKKFETKYNTEFKR